MEKLGEYIGFSYLVDKDDVRGYDGVPFEMILPFATGSDGEHMGWINTCPNDSSFKMPFVVWAPMGGYIFYIGSEVNEIVENQVRYLHEDDEYNLIDLEFLKSMGINPKNGKTEQLLINFEKELKPLPLNLPNNLKYQMTYDGTGVVALGSLFEESSNEESNSELSNQLKIAENKLENTPASSLRIAKNVYFDIWHEGKTNELYLPTIKLLYNCYDRLKMEEAKLLVKKEIEKS